MRAKDIILYGIWAILTAVVSFTVTNFSKTIEQHQLNIDSCQSELSLFKLNVAEHYARKEDLLRFEAKIDKLHDLFRQLIIEERKK